MRRGALLGATLGVGVTLALQLIHAAGVPSVPVFDDVLLRPGGILTWLFVLGDVGTPLQYAVWPLIISMVINGSIGALLGSAAGAWRERTA
jgi:hypothetical protein